jgi:hypothetical protein
MAFRVVVTGFIGTGTSQDPFRADVANPADVRLSIVDLSADRSAPDLCVAILDYGDGVATQPATRADGTSSGFGFWDLGEDPQIRLSGGRRTQLETRFGISIPNDATLGEAVLLKLGAALKPERDRMLRIRCGRVVLHEQLSISGGATDAFTYSDGDLHTVSGGVWVRHTDSPAIGGTIVVVSNAVDVGASTDGADRYGTDLASSIHYAQTVVTIGGTPAGTDVMAGPITRMGTTTTDVSGFVALAGSNTSAERFMLSRVDSGTFTTLDSDTTSAGTYELRLESVGSSQIMFVDEVNTLSATDTAYPSNTYTGIYLFHYGAYTAIIDDFENGTLAGPPPDPVVVTTEGSGNSATSTATLAFDCGDSFAAGDIIVVCISCDNAGGSGATSLSSVTDAGGNVYELLQATYDPVGASAGQTVGIAWARITTALITTDDVTINFSPNTTSKAAVVFKLDPDTGITLQKVTSGFTAGSATGTPTVTTASVAIGDVVIAALAAESNATVTQDGDSTNGAWGTQITATGNTGTSGTSSRVAAQHKIVTATATQTYNPTLTSCDNILGWIIFTPAFIRPQRAQVLPSAAVHRSRNW